MVNSFIEERNREMQDSLWLGFHYSNKLNEARIMESYSRVPDIDSYISKFLEIMDIMTYYGEHDNTFTITKNVFSDIKSCWFENIELTIEYVREANVKGKGFISVKNATLSNGKLSTLKGSFVFHGDWKIIKRYVPGLVSHEFLHNYECWKRLLGGGKHMFDIAADSGYLINNQIALDSDNDTEKILSEIFYFCHNVERRAYTAQINQELKMYREDIHDKESAFEILKSISLYNRYVKLGAKLQLLNNAYKTDDDIKKDIVGYYYKVTGKTESPKNIMNYMCRIYQKTWYYVRKKTTQFINKLYENNSVPPEWIEDFTPLFG